LTGKCFSLTGKCSPLTGKCFPLTNFPNGKQTWPSILKLIIFQREKVQSCSIKKCF
jgi:hypothetical protein